MLRAKVDIMLKKTVADPQGVTIKHALESLGYKEVDDVRIGKLVTVMLKIDDKQKGEKKLDEMCKKLLANPIIEDYSFTIEEA